MRRKEIKHIKLLTLSVLLLANQARGVDEADWSELEAHGFDTRSPVFTNLKQKFQRLKVAFNEHHLKHSPKLEACGVLTPNADYDQRHHQLRAYHYFALHKGGFPGYRLNDLEKLAVTDNLRHPLSKLRFYEYRQRVKALASFQAHLAPEGTSVGTVPLGPPPSFAGMTLGSNKTPPPAATTKMSCDLVKLRHVRFAKKYFYLHQKYRDQLADELLRSVQQPKTVSDPAASTSK